MEFEPDCIEAAARLSDRYIADRFLPDKAIDLVEDFTHEVTDGEPADAKVDLTSGQPATP